MDSERCPGLDRGPGDAVVVDVDLDDPGGTLHGAGDRRLVAAAPDIADIAGRLVVQRALGAERLPGPDQGRQRPVANVDPLRRVVGRRPGLGQDRGDRLADMPHAAARQRPAGRLRHRRPVLGRHLPEAGHGAHAVFRHIGAGQHGGGARHGQRRLRLDVEDFRMRMVGAQEAAMQRAEDGAIRHIVSPAGEKPPVLQPPD